MRILVIDDQCFTERREKFDCLELLGEVARYDSFPSWNFFEGYDIICWDNDLGGSSEVVVELRRLYWEDNAKFIRLFKDKLHVIHSANNVAGPRIVNLFESIGARAIIYRLDRFESLEL